MRRLVKCCSVITRFIVFYVQETPDCMAGRLHAIYTVQGNDRSQSVQGEKALSTKISVLRGAVYPVAECTLVHLVIISQPEDMNIMETPG